MEVTNHLIGDGDVLEKVLSANVENIRNTLDSISRSDFRDAVEAIVKARNIYIIGVRSSAMLAGFLSYILQLIFDNVRLVQPTSSSDVFEQILGIGENDVMIGISFPCRCPVCWVSWCAVSSSSRIRFWYVAFVHTSWVIPSEISTGQPLPVPEKYKSGYMTTAPVHGF
jgi:hypothetical protein